MNLIADEDDMLEAQVDNAVARQAAWIEQAEAFGVDYGSGCVLAPELGRVARPFQRRVVVRVLGLILGAEARVETASVEAVLNAYDADQGAPRGGYVANIQGDLAVSANKGGVRIEPMAAFRARRKRV